MKMYQIRSFVAYSLIACFWCLPAGAFESVTTLVGNSALAEKVSAGAYVSGDIWLKHGLADLDLYFEKDKAWLNVAQLKLQILETDVTIGRQQVGWGVGFLLNPIDMLNPVPLGSSLDPAYVRDGRDIIKLERYFGNYTKLELLYAGKFEKSSQNFDHDLGVKLKGRLFGYDTAVSYVDKGARSFSLIPELADQVYGLELSGTLPWEWGGWIEAAQYVKQQKTDYVLGTDYYYADYHLVLEYYRNGFGSANSSLYDLTLLFRGRMLAQDYLMPTLVWSVNEKLSLTSFNLYNMNDASMALGGLIDYYHSDNLEFIIMPIILKGANSTEYGMQKLSYGRYALSAKVKWVF
ncbi:hypothetical protein ACFL52_00935 [Candidatus Margulisiibacteriota bacterium]